MIDRRGLATGARLARRASPQIASEDGLRQRLAAQRVMPGLTRLQLIAGSADAQLLARHHCRADHGDDGHHQQHGDQRHAALATHCGSSFERLGHTLGAGQCLLHRLLGGIGQAQQTGDAAVAGVIDTQLHGDRQAFGGVLRLPRPKSNGGHSSCHTASSSR